jgi:cell division protein ZapA
MDKKTPASIRVKISGMEYPMVSFDDPDYMQEVADIVDKRMQTLSKLQADISPMKTAVLTALNLADELLRTRKQLYDYQEEAAHYGREIANRTKKLLDACPQL